MSHTKQIANIYNPGNLSEKELIDSFIIRVNEFKSIFAEIKNDPMTHPPQHYLIQGRRGSGKTTLILRLSYEIKNDPSLSSKLVPIVFNEEQYNIRTLYKFWENIAVHLEDEEHFLAGLYDEMQKHLKEEDYEEKCYGLLKTALRNSGKKLVLLIDNFGDMLNKFETKEHQRLREVLMTNADIRIIGASAAVLEFTYDYSKPFFEFFKIIQLKGLDQQESIDLLLKLGEKYNTEIIKKIVENNPGRIEALRRLTDGVPRTIVLLFDIFADDENGDSFRDLDMVLDRVTPLYKHRMDDLPVRQQEIIDVVAKNWDAITVKEISEKTRMESKAISAQLNLLEKNHIITKISTSTKNHLYQISERFFNIWYLMRYGRKKDKERVKWLTLFLELWCEKNDLITKAQGHLLALREGKMYEKCAYYMTEALSATAIPMELQHDLIEETRKYLEKTGSDLAKELSASDMELQKKCIFSYEHQNYEDALASLVKIQNKSSRVLYIIAKLFFMLGNTADAEKYYKATLEKGVKKALLDLGKIYETSKELKKATHYYKQALAQGLEEATIRLAFLYLNAKDYQLAEKYFLIADDKGLPQSTIALGDLNLELKQTEKAEYYYLKALDAKIPVAPYKLSRLYSLLNNKIKEEEYLLLAVNNNDFLAAILLAWFYLDTPNKKDEAVNTARKAMALVTSQRKSVYDDLYPFVYLEASCIMFFSNETAEAINALEYAITNNKVIEEEKELFKELMIAFIAKKQYHYVYNLFQKTDLNLKDHFKPIYYALMFFMRDEYPDEYRKMGSELTQTVEEIIALIKKMETDEDRPYQSS